MLKTEGIGYAYEDGGTVLRDVSFEVCPGEKLVLLGANGSGKTTLLKILDALLPAQTGSYWYDGQLVNKRALRDRTFYRKFRSEVALLFQSPDSMLFNPTVYDEIAFGPRRLGLADVESRVLHWAESLGLTRCLDTPPFRLSNGEKQKVCLASLLAMDPKVLLLDEPASSLDPRSTGWLVEFLQGLQTTTVTATHNLSLAPELGARALLLSESHELIYDGPTGELLKDKERLLRANLLHIHRHRHEALEHSHYHAHDWE